MNYLEQEIIKEFKKLLDKNKVTVTSRADSYIITKGGTQIISSKINNNNIRNSNLTIR